MVLVGVKKCHDDLKIIRKKLTPGRYCVPKFVPTKNDVNNSET